MTSAFLASLTPVDAPCNKEANWLANALWSTFGDDNAANNASRAPSRVVDDFNAYHSIIGTQNRQTDISNTLLQ
jgi:hypothetical protein